MEYATLRLSDEKDHTKYFDLKYKLIHNDFTKKWINCVLDAQQKQYNISEPWAIYNINNRLNDDFVLKRLNELISKVDDVEVLFGFKLESIHDQDTLNKIHSIFELHHGKLDEWKENPLFKNKSSSFRKNLSEINQFVHVCESRNGSPKIRIVWFDLPKVNTFTESDYKLFTDKRSFGSLYHLYADVGKNVESLAEDNDQHHHDFVPNLHFSADCVAFFCTDDQATVNKKKENYKNYITQNENYFKSKGYTIDDPRLTTGMIELGKLEDVDEQKLMDELKNYDHIQSFFLS